MWVNSFWSPRKSGQSDSMFVGHLHLHIVSPQAWHDVTVPPPRVQPLIAVHVEVLATPTQPTNTRAIPALAYLCIPLSQHPQGQHREPKLTAYTVQLIPQTWSYSPTHSTQDHSPTPIPSARRVDFSSYPQVLPTSILGRQAHSGSSSKDALQVSSRSACQPPAMA